MRCPGKSKGTAIKAILADLKPDLPIAFLGDDLTDEDGFAAIEGRGLGVLVRSEQRQTRAALRIAPPNGVLEFLENWCKNARRKGLLK